MFKSTIMIVLVCMISSTSIFAAMSEKINYSETVDCGSVTLTDIFRRARLWVSQSAPDNKTLVSDKETGDLATQGNITLVIPRSENSSGGVYQFRYVLSVECANRKYRASIAHVEFVEGGSNRAISLEAFGQKTENKAAVAELDTKFKTLLADLQQNVKDYKPF